MLSIVRRTFVTCVLLCIVLFNTNSSSATSFLKNEPTDCIPANPEDLWWCYPDDANGIDTGDGHHISIFPPPQNAARLGPDGRNAIAPQNAPHQVVQAVKAGNQLTRKPYRWGGGHRRPDNDKGYDCSGAVSYVLRSIKAIDGAPVSGQLKSWGEPGEGKWITVYTNRKHVFMKIAGMRFDTSPLGEGEKGPRWRTWPRSKKGFIKRHPPGL